MTHFEIYLIISIIALATNIFASWYEGDDQTIGSLIAVFMMSFLPLVNIMLILFGIARICFSHQGTVILKGKKR